jgi:hypothetical protein
VDHASGARATRRAFLWLDARALRARLPARGRPSRIASECEHLAIDHVDRGAGGVGVKGRLVWTAPSWGTFALDPQPDGTLLEEDSHERYYPVRDAGGAFAGVATAAQVADGARPAGEQTGHA